MPTPLLAVVLAIALSGTAAAQSSIIDLSKPMTGKSSFVINADGTPAELGVSQYDGGAVATHDTQDAGGIATSSSPKTVKVQGYTRKDGTEVRALTRSASRARR